MKKFDPKKYPCKEIPKNLFPRDYTEAETNHLIEIGVRKGPGIVNDVPGINVGHLYFEDKTVLAETMKDLRKINVLPVVKCSLTRIVIYSPENGSLLYYYLKGKNIDCQGVHKTYIKKSTL